MTTKNEALKALKQKIHYDKEVYTWCGVGFWETTVSIGGDLRTYRIYDGGVVTER